MISCWFLFHVNNDIQYVKMCINIVGVGMDFSSTHSFSFYHANLGL